MWAYTVNMTKKSTHYDSVLAEDLREQLKFIIEALKALAGVPAELKQMREELKRSNDRHDLSELVVKHQSKTLNNQETRIGKLETA